MTFFNIYHCGDCETSWAYVWGAQCDDKCPKCHKACCPETSEEIQGKYSSKIDPIDPIDQSPKEYMEFTD